jgi:hypothetical protein
MTSARFAVADFQRLVTRLFRATVQLEKDLVIAADVAVYGITRGESPVVSISDAVTRCAAVAKSYASPTPSRVEAYEGSQEDGRSVAEEFGGGGGGGEANGGVEDNQWKGHGSIFCELQGVVGMLCSALRTFPSSRDFAGDLDDSTGETIATKMIPPRLLSSSLFSCSSSAQEALALRLSDYFSTEMA